MKAVYIFACSIFMVHLTASPHGNNPVTKKPSCSAPNQKNMQEKTPKSLAINETTTSKIKYFFVASAVLLNGPMSKY